MAKIYICDHLGSHRTTRQIENWMSGKGHEVKWTQYWEPDQGRWCDTALFAWTEGMLHRAIDLNTPENKGEEPLKGKKVVTYLMDIEMWAGQHNGTDWSKVDGLAYCSQYVYDVFAKESDLPASVKVRHIPLSVDMKEWTHKESNPNGRNIAVLGHMWPGKGAQMIPEFMRRLIDKTGDNSWKIYIQGEWRHDVWRWYQYYFNNLVKDLGLENNVFVNEAHIPSIDEWMNDKDYFISFSMKEAFSLPMAETLAKGIPAFTHNFPGAKEIWGDYTWSSIDELIDKVLVLVSHEGRSSNLHREYVENRYSNEIIGPKWEELLL